MLAGPRSVATAAERQVQEARTAYERGDYQHATTVAGATTEPISAALKDLHVPPTAPANRRR